MKTYITIALTCSLALAIGMHRQISGVYAQTVFTGATVVTDDYFNCEPGAAGCEAQTRTVHTFGQDKSVSEFRYWLKAAQAASDPLLGDVNTPAASTHIFGAVGEYYTIRMKHPKPPETALNLSGDCLALASPGHTKTGTNKDVKGYRAVVFKSSGSMTTLTLDYLPELGCISVPERAVSMNGPFTVSVPVDIHAGFDPGKLSVAPAGMIEVSPTVGFRDSTTKSLRLQGFTQAQIDERWAQSIAHSPLDQYEKAWKAGLSAK